MRVLFDHGTPSGIAAWLVDHKVTESRELGWEKLSNGELLRVAENAGFEVLLTTDKNIALQQNLKGRAIGVVALGNSPWRIVQRYVRRITAAVNGSTPGSYTEIDIPFR